MVLLGGVASFGVEIGTRFNHAIIERGRWALIIDLPVIICLGVRGYGLLMRDGRGRRMGSWDENARRSEGSLVD